MVRGEGSGTALLRANATGYGQGTLSVVVTHNLISTPSTLNVAFGGSTALPINIGPDPAPAGGLTLEVASSDADIEVLTPQVTVPAGALSVNATVRGARVGTANVTVSNPNYAPSTTVVTSRAELNIVQTSASFNQGLPATDADGAPREQWHADRGAARVDGHVDLREYGLRDGAVAGDHPGRPGQHFLQSRLRWDGDAALHDDRHRFGHGCDAGHGVDHRQPSCGNQCWRRTLTVGAGLMDSASASVNASQHGGVDVTITAGTEAQPGPVRLSRTATEVGTQSITVHLNNGQTSISYYVHALENTTGSSTDHADRRGVDRRLAHGRCRATRRRDSQAEPHR